MAFVQENHEEKVNITFTGFPRPAPRTTAGPTINFEPPKVYVKKLDVGTIRIVLKWEKTSTNRIIHADQVDLFMIVSFKDLKFEVKPSQNGERPKNPNVDYIKAVLTGGVCVNGVLYNFYGHSSSQLEEKTCVFFAGAADFCWNKIRGLGDFSRLRSVAKLAKRVGLFFSNCQMVLEVKQEEFQVIPDDVNDYGEVFSDGCGYISKELMKAVAKTMKLKHRENRLVPSVIQIRYRGFKGVLAINPNITNIQFRESMKKFDCTTDNRFYVADHSQPYSFGRLNQQIIALLSTLGVSNEVFLRLQKEHYAKLEQMPYDAKLAFGYLCSLNEVEMANDLAENGLTKKIQDHLKSLQGKEMEDGLHRSEKKQRLRIRVNESRTVFCVNDPTGELEEGQCFFAPTIDDEVKVITGLVIAVRNPCMYPGDILHLMAVDNPRCHHLVDCVVFPVKGRRSTASASAGGDLDGDKFRMIWDTDLIPPQRASPYGYPPASETIGTRIDRNSMIEYFANFNNGSLGKIDKFFWQWANRKGILSDECAHLNRLFSSAVDGQYIPVPPHLDPAVSPIPFERNKMIWEQMLSFAEEKYEQHKSGVTRALQHDSREAGFLTFEALMDIVQSDNICLGDYDLLRVCHAWWAKQPVESKCSQFCDFVALNHIDFTNFSYSQKQWALNAGMPLNIMYNALNRSDLLKPKFLRDLQLDHERFHWKLHYSSNFGYYTDERFLMATLADGLCNFTRTLIVLQYSEDFTVAIYVPVQLKMGENNPVQHRVIVFGFRGGRLFEKRVMHEEDMFVYIDENRFQLFRGLEANDTFIWMKRTVEPTVVNERKHQPANCGAVAPRPLNAPLVAMANLSSIAVLVRKWFKADLTRYMTGIKKQKLLGVEVFVVSNKKPVRVRSCPTGNSMTVEMLPEIPPPDYELSGLDKPSAEDADTVAELKIVLANRQLPSCTVEQLLALVDCAGRYGRADQRSVLIEQFLTRHAFSDIPLSAFFSLSLIPSAVIVFLKKLRSSSQQPDTTQCSLILAALIRCSATEGQFAVVEATKLVTAVLEQHQKFAVSALAACFFAVALTEDPAIGLEFSELFNNAELCSSPYFVEFAYKLCLDLLEEKAETLESAERNRERSLADGKIPEDLGYRGVTFSKKLPEKKRGNEENEPPTKKKKPMEERKFVYTVKGLSLNKLRVGEVVRITRLNKRKGCSEKEAAQVRTIQGVISEISPAIQVQFHVAPPAEIEAAIWHLQSVGNSTTFKQSLNALERFVTDQRRCTSAYDLVMRGYAAEKAEEPMEVDEPNQSDITPGLEQHLKKSQMKALKAALSGRLTLIQGPPGTGKTHTIVSILAEMVKKYGVGEVLAVASTNVAADNILSGLIKNEFFEDLVLVRAGDRSAIGEKLREYSLDAHVQGDSNRKLSEVKKVIQRAAVVISTCASAGTSILKGFSFQCVVMDEASQVTEPCALIPIVKGTKQVVLVGDHKQLPPTVKGVKASEAGLGWSLFARLCELCESSPDAIHMLEEHFRCHPFIIQFPSEQFYDGKLKAMIRASERPTIPGFDWPQPGKPVALIDMVGENEKSKGTSKKNEKEAAVVLDIVKSVLAANAMKMENSIGPNDIGIVTGYTGQISCIEAAMKRERGMPKVEIASVDGFQGREKELIIFSGVRSNGLGTLGFLDDARRFNVLMTRARRGLIVVASQSTLRASKDPLWNRWLDYVEMHGLLKKE